MMFLHPQPRPKADDRFRSEVLAGLGKPQRSISSRWLYDQRGSELFEAITKLPEYYPTRSEAGLIRRHCAEICQSAGEGRAVIDFGAGSSSKTQILLHRLNPSALAPVDISGDFLRRSARALASSFPEIPVSSIEADFTAPLALPARLSAAPRLGLFLGSTIGNFTPLAAIRLLQVLRDTLASGAMLLIGFDLEKDAAVLQRAYDDRGGVTAAFNLNLLRRINRELDGDIPVEAFHHVARWNGRESRIEMHLEARRNVRFSVAGRSFAMSAGESVHTENSYKYPLSAVTALLGAGSWTPIGEWTDRRYDFALILAQAGGCTA